MTLDKDEMEKLIKLGYTQADYESWKTMSMRYVDTPFDGDKPELTEAEYDAKVKERLDFPPLQLMTDAFHRACDTPPRQTYREDQKTGMYTCTIPYNDKVYSGTSRHKKTAGHIAATYLLEDAIKNDNSEYFFLPKNKNEALKLMKAKREALKKTFEESKESWLCIYEYALYHEFKLNVDFTDGPPYSAIMKFEGVAYIGEPASTKKESTVKVAKVIYDALLDSGKYQEFKRAQAETGWVPKFPSAAEAGVVESDESDETSVPCSSTSCPDGPRAKINVTNHRCCA